MSSSSNQSHPLLRLTEDELRVVINARDAIYARRQGVARTIETYHTDCLLDDLNDLINRQLNHLTLRKELVNERPNNTLADGSTPLPPAS